jgi:hypothetical protein
MQSSTHNIFCVVDLGECTYRLVDAMCCSTAVVQRQVDHSRARIRESRAAIKRRYAYGVFARPPAGLCAS